MYIEQEPMSSLHVSSQLKIQFAVPEAIMKRIIGGGFPSREPLRDAQYLDTSIRHQLRYVLAERQLLPVDANNQEGVGHGLSA
jgi:hypothetical protein